MEYVRKWLFAHTKILAVLELPVETFLISGREGTGTLTAILLVERRNLEETVQILEGTRQIENYPIFMADVKKVGYDRRGNQIYVKDDEGREITVEKTLVSGDKKQRVQEKIIDNELPSILEKYLEYSNNLRNNKVYYDLAEGKYRVHYLK